MGWIRWHESLGGTLGWLIVWALLVATHRTALVSHGHSSNGRLAMCDGQREHLDRFAVEQVLAVDGVNESVAGFGFYDGACEGVEVVCHSCGTLGAVEPS